jgi:hypothetical protein
VTARAENLDFVWTKWTRLVRPRTAAVAATAAVAGVATDLALRNGPPTVSGAILVFVAAAGLLVAARPSNRQAIALIAAAPLFGVWLVLRFSVWILPLDVVAAGGLLAFGAAYARGGSILDLSFPAAVVHGLRAVANALLAPGYLFSGGRHPGRRAAAVRGVLFALPLLIVVVALLASADAVFASVFHVHWTDVAFHVFAVSLGAWTMASLVRLASVGPATDISITVPKMGAVEWTIVLGSLDVVLAAFAAARVVALTQGGKHVIATAGLSYAQYARSGFFQLVTAAVIALGALLVVRAVADRAGALRRFVVLSEVAIALLLVVVVQAVQRLALYERAFGLTMPRVWATTIAVWIGVALVLLGVWIAGVGRDRTWFWTAAGGAALAMLLALNVISPEALVVHRNVSRAVATHKFDASELNDLTDDAVPALAASLDRLDAADQTAARTWLCGHSYERHSVFGYNLSNASASAARSRVCDRRNP